MRIAQVIGTVTATAKDPQLAGQRFLLVDVQDEEGKVLEPSVVAIDTIGAGTGERVLIVTGSAARVATNVSGIVTDAAIVGIIDEIAVN